MLPDPDPSTQPTEREVWSSELVAIAASLGVMAVGFCVYVLLAAALPVSWRWGLTVATAVPAFWLARRVYARVLRRRRFAADRLGTRNTDWEG
ncbi:hypothetical protein GCM10027053_35970 [Intrasporangium mesophilum]